jgi:hypothetical protein
VNQKAQFNPHPSAFNLSISPRALVNSSVVWLPKAVFASMLFCSLIVCLQTRQGFDMIVRCIA